MQATGLFLADPAVQGRLHRVPRARRGGEEPERVVVAAPDRVRPDHLVGAGRTQSQPVPGVPDLLAVLLEDHRPFVQPEAAELGGGGRGRGQQPPDEPQLGAARGQEGGYVHTHHVPFPVEYAVEPPTGPLRRIRQRPAESRVPPPELAGPQGVIAEEEVLDRVRDGAAGPIQMAADEGINPGLVGGLTFAPAVRRQHPQPGGRGGRRSGTARHPTILRPDRGRFADPEVVRPTFVGQVG